MNFEKPWDIIFIIIKHYGKRCFLVLLFNIFLKF